MASLSLFLDTRRVDRNGECKFRILVSHAGKNSLISLDLSCSPDYWDGVKIVKRRDRSSLNQYLQTKLFEARSALGKVASSGRLHSLDAKGLKDAIMDILEPKVKSSLVEPFLQSYAETKSPSRKRCLYSVLRHLKSFDDDFSSLTFDGVDKSYVKSFLAYLYARLATNTVDLYMSCLKTLFNAAMDFDLTSNYPFRRIKIKRVPTRKRNLTVEQLRVLWSLPLSGRKAFARDFFFLSFFLIGMNVADIFKSTGVNASGRVDYVRSKTSKPYSIKVEPEAMDIIRRYPCETSLIGHGYLSHSSLVLTLNAHLHHIGQLIGVPGLTTYYARHSWASIASEIGVPFDTIARALGHGGNTVTDVYIAYDYRKVDEANRMVIDRLFSGL